MKFSEPLSDPTNSAVGPGFLLVQDDARPQVCRQFLDDKGIDAIDLASQSPQQVVPQTVQELTDALIQVCKESH